MELEIRRWFTMVEERALHAGFSAEPPLRKVAAIAVVANPYAGQSVEDLTPLVTGSIRIGALLAEKAVAAMHPYAVASYGKGGIVGIDGEQEHINALLTSDFAKPVREAFGSGKAWVPSYTKLGAPGVPIDIPLAHKDALYVRSHYDGMTLALPETPMPDEVAIIICVANRGRIGARVGGIKAEEITGQDGLY